MTSKYVDSFDSLLLTDPKNHMQVETLAEARGIRQFFYRRMQETVRDFRLAGVHYVPKKCRLLPCHDGVHLWLEAEAAPEYKIIQQPASTERGD